MSLLDLPSEMLSVHVCMVVKSLGVATKVQHEMDIHPSFLVGKPGEKSIIDVDNS
jgi:hypothetical protein